MVAPCELRRAVSEGFIETAEIAVDGVPHYSVWFSLTCDGVFHLNAACQLVERPAGLVVLSAGVEQLARERGAKFVRFNTARPGLIEQSAGLGYVPVAVCMMKPL